MLPKSSKTQELIQALTWIQQNLFRQSAAATAAYWRNKTDYPCAQAQASLDAVDQSTLKMSPHLAAALRRAQVYELYMAFQTPLNTEKNS